MDGGWFRGLPWVWESLVLSHVETDANRGLVGLSLGKVAELRAADPGDTLLDLIDEEDNHVGVVAHNRTEADMRVFLAHPQSMIGSDGKAISPTGAWADDKPHPRFYGTYPRILGRYVRDEPVISLESAVYKMSGFPAARIGLRDRGRIEEGLAADIVVFDPDSGHRPRHVRRPAEPGRGGLPRSRRRRGRSLRRRPHRGSPRQGTAQGRLDATRYSPAGDALLVHPECLVGPYRGS